MISRLALRTGVLRSWVRTYKHSTTDPMLLETIEKLDLESVPDLPHRTYVPLSMRFLKKRADLNTDKQRETHPLTNQQVVVMVHGFFGNKNNWLSVGRRISQDMEATCVGVDLRNHGESPHSYPFDYIAMASDLIHFVESHRILQPTLVGHSMGAKVVMVAALLKPHLFPGIVVVDNSPVDQKLDDRFLLDLVGLAAIDKMQLEASTWKQKDRLYKRLAVKEGHIVKTFNYIQNEIQKYHGKELKVLEKELASFEPDKLVRTFLMSNVTLDEYANQLRVRMPVLNMIKDKYLDHISSWPEKEMNGRRYDGRVLVLRGTKSNFITEEHLKEEFPKYFNMQKLKVRDVEAGHWLVSEKPGEFINAIEYFLPGLVYRKKSGKHYKKPIKANRN